MIDTAGALASPGERRRHDPHPGGTVKALSLHQPWATLIAIGAKRLETRGYWPYTHRGDLAIHAARRWTRDLRALCEQDPFRRALTPEALRHWPGIPGDRAVEGRKALHQYLHNAGTPRGIPLGALVARSQLNNVLRTEALTAPCGGCKGRGRIEGDGPGAGPCPLCGGRPLLEPQERAFGNFAPGRRALDLGPTVAIRQPIDYRGQRGLFDLDATTAHQVTITAPLPWEHCSEATLS
jgi:activating signal cointegrator 1